MLRELQLRSETNKLAGITHKQNTPFIIYQRTNMSNDYSDIIDLPHPTSKTHPPMSRHQRAAQFAPFAALTGHNDLIEETARAVNEPPDPEDEQDF